MADIVQATVSVKVQFRELNVFKKTGALFQEEFVYIVSLDLR